MSYPTISIDAANRLVELIKNEKPYDLFEFITHSEDGDCDIDSIISKSDELKADWDDNGEKDPSETDLHRLEARMAGPLHQVLKGLDPMVLSDKGFWRYLALDSFLWYLRAREPELQIQDYGGKDSNFKAQLLFRTFLWGKIAFDPSNTAEPYCLATKVGELGGAEIDVWHSHMLRVQLGQLGEFPKAFLEAICEPPTAVKTDEARSVEKLLTRRKNSVNFDIYDRTQALEAVRKLKDIPLGD